jgi:hypothetical protein
VKSRGAPVLAGAQDDEGGDIDGDDG